MENYYTQHIVININKLLINDDTIKKEVIGKILGLFVTKCNNKINWDVLSSHDRIMLGNIEDNIELPWNWKYISRNPNLTIKFIEKHIEKPWNITNVIISLTKSEFKIVKDKINRDILQDEIINIR